MSTEYDFSKWTPLDSTGYDYDVFKSAYKNLRFAIPVSSKHSVTQTDMVNLPGIAYQYYGDVSLWLAIMYFNGLSDPIQDIYPGLQLNMFNKSDLIAYFSAQQKNDNMTLTI